MSHTTTDEFPGREELPSKFPLDNDGSPDHEIAVALLGIGEGTDFRHDDSVYRFDRLLAGGCVHVNPINEVACQTVPPKTTHDL